MKIEADGFKFDFKGALDVFVFDEKDKSLPTYHGLTHAAMQSVDLVVELSDRYLFVEMKDFHSPEEYEGKSRLNHLIECLKHKYRDTWMYRWAEKKVDKPIHYICLLALESPLLSGVRKELRQVLPTGRPISRWKREVMASCQVVNLDCWNRTFKKWPVERS